METQTTTREQQKPFEIKEALNDVRFTEFFSKYPDAEDFQMSEDEAPEIEKRWEAFKNQDEARKQLRDVYTKEISKDLGIQLTPEHLQAVDTFIEQAVIKDPGAIREILTDLKEYKELPEKIEKANRDLTRHGSKEYHKGIQTQKDLQLEHLKKKREEQGKKGLIHRGASILWSGEKRLKTYDQEILNINKELEAIERAIGQHSVKEETGNKLRGNLQEIKRKLYEDTELAEVMAEKAQQLLRNKFYNVDADPLNILEKKYEEITALKEKMESAETTTGMNYFADMDLQERTVAIDQKIERLLQVDIQTALLKLPDAGLTYNRVETAIKKFVHGREKIGSREGAEAKLLIERMIFNLINQKDNPIKGTKLIIFKGFFQEFKKSN